MNNLVKGSGNMGSTTYTPEFRAEALNMKLARLDDAHRIGLEQRNVARCIRMQHHADQCTPCQQPDLDNLAGANHMPVGQQIPNASVLRSPKSRSSKRQYLPAPFTKRYMRPQSACLSQDGLQGLVCLTKVSVSTTTLSLRRYTLQRLGQYWHGFSQQSRDQVESSKFLPSLIGFEVTHYRANVLCAVTVLTV